MRLTTIFLAVLLTMSLNAEMKYPYVASKSRIDLILSNYAKIKVGDSEKVVLTILSQPDEILDLYEAKKYKAKIIGKTYWYILQRLSNTGSVSEKQEKVVRISFDMQDKVVKVEHWGVEE